MHDGTDDSDSGQETWLTPPPPPPAPNRARRRLIGRRGATVAVASGLVIGGVAGGYVISHAASPSPSATAGPSTGGTAPDGRHGPTGFGGGGPASRAEDLQQVAGAIGITSTQLQTEMSAGKTIAAIAKEHNVAVSKVISTLVADENAEVDAALKAGTITSAQATQMKAHQTQRVTDMVNGTGPAHGPDGRGGPGGPGGLQAEDQQLVASTIGITSTQLQTEMSAGKTIAAIAKEHNVAASTVINAWVKSENSEIDQRLSSGQVTAAQAAQDKTMTTQRITDLVNGTEPAHGFGGPGGPPGGAPGGPPPAN
jgi:thymidine kinase